MKIKLDPTAGYFYGGGTAPTAPAPAPALNSAIGPQVAGQYAQISPGYQPSVVPAPGYPQPAYQPAAPPAGGIYANPYIHPYQPSAPPQFNGQFLQPTQPGTYQNPIPVTGGPAYQPQPQQLAPVGPQFIQGPYPIAQPAPAQIPAYQPQGQPTGYQFAPTAPVPAYQMPFPINPLPQGQPVAGQPQPQILATLPGQAPLDREPQTLQEAQQVIQAARLERIQAMQSAGKSQEAIQLLDNHYRSQLAAAHTLIAQRDQAISAATQDKALGDSLAGIVFRDQQSALNCRTIVSSRLEVAADGQVRERGTGRPAQQAIQDYLRGDCGVFLAPSTQGGLPAPQGQYPAPTAGPLSVGELSLQRYQQGLRAGIAQGNFQPGYQTVLQPAPQIHPAFR